MQEICLSYQLSSASQGHSDFYAQHFSVWSLLHLWSKKKYLMSQWWAWEKDSQGAPTEFCSGQAFGNREIAHFPNFYFETILQKQRNYIIHRVFLCTYGKLALTLASHVTSELWSKSRNQHQYYEVSLAPFLLLSSLPLIFFKIRISLCSLCCYCFPFVVSKYLAMRDKEIIHYPASHHCVPTNLAVIHSACLQYIWLLVHT